MGRGNGRNTDLSALQKAIITLPQRRRERRAAADLHRLGTSAIRVLNERLSSNRWPDGFVVAQTSGSRSFQVQELEADFSPSTLTEGVRRLRALAREHGGPLVAVFETNGETVMLGVDPRSSSTGLQHIQIKPGPSGAPVVSSVTPIPCGAVHRLIAAGGE